MIHGRGALRAILVAATCAASASGQSADDTVHAEQLFHEATVLVDRGDYAAACPRFEESHRLDPALGTQYNLALCYEKIGRLGSAWRNMRAVEKLAHATGKKGREEVAHQILVRLRPRTAHLVLSARSADVTVKVDSDRVGPEDMPFFAVDPGQHTVTAAAPGKEPWETPIVVANGSEAEIRVDVPPLADKVGPTRVVMVRQDTSNSRRTAGLVSGAVGLTGMAVAVTTGILLLRAQAAVDQNCTPGCVNQEGRDALARGRTLIPINWIAWGVGLVGLGVGAFLILTSGPKKPAVTQFARFGTF